MATVLNEIHAGELMQRLTLRVKLVGFRRMKVRAWLGMKLISLGIAIMGCKAEISDDWAA